jgi:hypothetical protein
MVYTIGMRGALLLGKGGKVENPASKYNPPVEVRELTALVSQAYADGQNTLTTPLREYNNRSITEQENQARQQWLGHPDAPYEGDDEWRWNGIRPISRNRAISFAAHITAELIYPKSFAQNDDQEEDRAAAYCMDALVEYHIRNSEYETAFLFGVIGAMVSPINYFKVEYSQDYSEAWQNGEYKKVLDDVFSGFQYSLKPIDEILFGNPYVYEWQKQDWIIERERVSYEEMYGKFGTHENFAHVQQGTLTMVHDDGFFYDVEDINDGLVGHVKYKHRKSDLEIDFVNGIYLSNPNTAYNPFYHRTNSDKPEYDTVKYGFEPIDSMRFVGYKSLMDKMENDQDAVDREWQDYFDASRLATFPPSVTMGAGRMDSSVITPSGITEIGKDAKFEPISVTNPAAAAAAVREAERSANESSMDPQASGLQTDTEKTKAESLILQENATVVMGPTARMIAIMVRDVGRLIVHDIARFETVGNAGEIAGEMLYKTFALPNRIKEGRNKTTYVKFTDKLAGRKMTRKEKEMEEYKLMDEAGDDKELIVANPGVFANLKFNISVDPEQLMGRNSKTERAFKIAAYDKAISNQLVMQDPEAQIAITRDFLFEPIMGGNASKYLPKLRQMVPEDAATGTRPQGGDAQVRNQKRPVV